MIAPLRRASQSANAQVRPLRVPSSLQAGSCRQEEGDHKGRPYDTNGNCPENTESFEQ